MACFALLGLVLAILGVYGLTAFEVRRRFREIGIRLSLGAEPESVRTLVLRPRILLAGAGISVGLVAAALLANRFESLLYGITVRDPVTWLGAVVVVLGACWLAAYLPARWATRVDPTEVLGAE